MTTRDADLNAGSRGSPADATASATLPGVQYLRGFAALLVVAFHASANIADPAILGRSGPALFDYGYLGVDLFFVISGFIITYTTLDRSTGRAFMTVRDFATRRFMRIVPFMWVCIVAYALLRLAGRGADIPTMSYLRAMLLWPVGELKPDVIWTLRHEALFYAVFALTFLTRPGLRPVFALWALSSLLLDAIRPIGTLEKAHDLLEFIANPVNLQFGFGVAIGLLATRPAASWSRAAAPFLRGAWGLAVLAALSLGLMATGYALDLHIMTIRTALIAGILASIMLALGIAVPSRHPDGRGAVISAGRLAGDASYAIYLTHIPVMLVLLSLLRRFAPQASWGVAMVGVVLGALSVGVAVHLLVEGPLVRRMKRIGGLRHG